MRKNKQNKEKCPNRPCNMREDGSIITDPDGSYTGVPIGGDVEEKPIQDVDDL